MLHHGPAPVLLAVGAQVAGHALLPGLAVLAAAVGLALADRGLDAQQVMGAVLSLESQLRKVLALFELGVSDLSIQRNLGTQGLHLNAHLLTHIS